MWVWNGPGPGQSGRRVFGTELSRGVLEYGFRRKGVPGPTRSFRRSWADPPTFRPVLGSQESPRDRYECESETLRPSVTVVVVGPPRTVFPVPLVSHSRREDRS